MKIERRPLTGRQIQTRYRLERAPGRCVVTVERPDGPDLVPEPLGGERPPEYEWGYVGDGPRELAEAILKDIFGEIPATIDLQLFADEFVASLPPEGLILTRAMLLNWLELRFPAAAGGNGRDQTITGEGQTATGEGQRSTGGGQTSA